MSKTFKPSLCLPVVVVTGFVLATVPFTDAAEPAEKQQTTSKSSASASKSTATKKSTPGTKTPAVKPEKGSKDEGLAEGTGLDSGGEGYEPYRPKKADVTVPRAEGDVRKSQKGVYVINNDDLERMFGKSSVKPASGGSYGGGFGRPAANSAESSDGEFLDGDALEAQARVNELNEQISRLRRNLQTLRNPFLGRPKLTEDERRSQEGLDANRRIEMTNIQIQKLQLELAQLTKKANIPPD